jgi:hypothetical protein
MRPIVEVTVACRADGCVGRVHVHATRRGRPPVGVCDLCGEVAVVDLTAEDPAAGRSAPLLAGAAL